MLKPVKFPLQQARFKGGTPQGRFGFVGQYNVLIISWNYITTAGSCYRTLILIAPMLASIFKRKNRQGPRDLACGSRTTRRRRGNSGSYKRDENKNESTRQETHEHSVIANRHSDGLLSWRTYGIGRQYRGGRGSVTVTGSVQAGSVAGLPCPAYL